MKLRVISEVEGTDHCVMLDNGEALEGVSRVDVVAVPGDIPRLVIEIIDFEAQIARRPKKRIFMDQSASS
ncbi:MAG: hypothetical protein ACREDO_13680 [Methyloceanibacter sp.]